MYRGLDSIINYKIIEKLKKAGAISERKAVTADEAKLSLQECGWLQYLAGGLTSIIKKTADGRYYV